ncbi:3-deoxy-manno-octulosonate cytidylyltransferase [Ornithobacterium rhinotracheale]|uniref:3-deoxy-manno-octulosonate cytidylyltransferase n=1 Tax=Ornithobacterium rhinotracheale TaxID=28251 RepID=UPI001FF1DBED|nr:3-deoxy-manno-octulosonate cytidylyltransferase [Ornithobacterium rhinotracheale]MCK0205188.1 3-deoxy-manno-octulosonate cytidylyltransferase [Ornithobacterium rhinotracheale]
MKVVAVIPARYNSQRFPGKLMQKLNGKELILYTYEAVKNTELFDDVIVATDDARILACLEKNNAKVQLTAENHVSGSDRIAEVAQNLDADIIVNVQGDEPFITAEDLKTLIQIFENDTQKEVAVGSLMEIITESDMIENPNNVKVVVDRYYNALYFSRSVIPYAREMQENTTYYKHLGIYAFRRDALLSFATLDRGSLEPTEKLEQLRYLENGFKIRLGIAKNPSIGIDTPEDLAMAEAFIQQNK